MARDRPRKLESHDKSDSSSNNLPAFNSSAVRAALPSDSGKSEGGQIQNKHFDIKLSELTTKRVIMLVLGIMFTVPGFTISTYLSDSYSFTLGLDLLTVYDDIYGSPEFQQIFDQYVTIHQQLSTPLVFASAYNISWNSNTTNVSLGLWQRARSMTCGRSSRR